MLAADVSHKRGLLTALATLLIAAALSGCVGADEEVDPSGAGGSPCAELEGNVIEVIIPAGASTGAAGVGIEIPDLENATTPATLCVANMDDVDHPFVALPGMLDTTRPDWIPASAGSSDPHAAHKAAAAGDGDGHDHAHGDGDETVGLTPIFEQTIESGRVLAMTDFGYHGTITVQSGQFTHMQLNAEFLPAEPVDYPVQQNVLILEANATGDTAAGETDVQTFDVQATDLKKVSATLAWDDSLDDNAVSNDKDTLKLVLKDPAGNEVASKEATGGQLQVSFEPELIASPESVSAQGYTAAVEALKTARAQDDSTVGTWTFEVHVPSAPGLLPDEDGTTQELLVGDGHQEWTLDVTFAHIWHTVVPADGKAAPERIVADFE